MKNKVSRKFSGGPGDDVSIASAGRAMPQPGVGMGRGRGMEMRNANAMPGARAGMPSLPAQASVPSAVRPFALKKGGAVAGKKAGKYASGGSLRGYGISKKIRPSGPMC